MQVHRVHAVLRFIARSCTCTCTVHATDVYQRPMTEMFGKEVGRGHGRRRDCADDLAGCSGRKSPLVLAVAINHGIGCISARGLFYICTICGVPSLAVITSLYSYIHTITYLHLDLYYNSVQSLTM